MTPRQREILVFADWVGIDAPRRMGTLHAVQGRGKEDFRFEYDRDWLASKDRESVDPELALFDGPQYPRENRAGHPRDRIRHE